MQVISNQLTKIRELEIQHKWAASTTVTGELQNYRQALRLLLIPNPENHLKRFKAVYFSQGNKKQTYFSLIISELDKLKWNIFIGTVDPISHTVVYHPKHIANAFQKNYQLYNLKTDSATPQPTENSIFRFLSFSKACCRVWFAELLEAPNIWWENSYRWLNPWWITHLLG